MPRSEARGQDLFQELNELTPSQNLEGNRESQENKMKREKAVLKMLHQPR